jgi:tRNA(adenine34) deaminase
MNQERDNIMKSPEKNHAKWMLKALKEAEKAFEQDEVPVGAIVVKDGKIIAKAHNTREKDHAFHGHAEFLAMLKAQKKLGDWRLNDCDIYVTLEPCPMCAGAMIQSRIRKVYYAAVDPKGGAVESQIQLFQYPWNHHVEAEQGLYEIESQTLLKNFFKLKR